jgi:twitching motility protein PilJ
MAQRKVKVTLTFKILSAILFIIIATATATGLFLYNTSKDIRITSVYDELASRLDELKDRLEIDDKMITGRLKTISSSPLMVNFIKGRANVQGVKKVFSQVVKSDPAIRGVFITNKNAKLMAQYLDFDEPLPELDEIIDTEEMSPTTPYFEPYLTQEFPYFIYYKAIVSNGEIVGVLGIVADGNNILTTANASFTRKKDHAPNRECSKCHDKQKPLSEKGFTVVFDSDGNLLLSPLLKDGLILKNKPEFTKIFKQASKELKKSRIVEQEFNIKGKTYLAAFSIVELNSFKMTVGYFKNKDFVLASLNKGRLISFGTTILIAIIVFIITSISFRKVFSPLFALSNAMEKVREGDYDIRVEVTSTDELGALGDGFNEMLNRIGGFIQTEEDKERIQRQAIGLMDVVSQAADGDMTVEAEVTADELGAVADAFNMMTASIRELINDIKMAGDSIVDATEQLLQSAEKTSQGAAIQIEELNKTTEKIKLFERLSMDVSEKAKEAAQITEDAADTAGSGLNMLNETIDSMMNVRRYSQMASKKVKSLGERSMEIGEITNVISDISYQTNLLALNAAIEAARAGEYGHGFAVVADEIRKLAERSNTATKEIAELIKSIQVETAETVKLVEESTVNIEQSSTLAEQAGTSLKNINLSLSETKETVSNIAVDITQQAQEAASVADSIAKVREISVATSEDVKKTNTIVTTLSQLAEMFKEAVDKFKVDDNG